MVSYTTPPAPPVTNPVIGMTAQNNAITSTAQVKYGTAAFLANGTSGNDYILNTSGDFAWWPSGTSDFTVQWWQYIPSGTSNNYMEFASNEESGGGFGYRLGPGYGAASYQGVNIFARGQADLNYSTNTWVNDTWQFVSICRNAATMYIHVDGVSQALSGSGGGARNFTATSGLSKISIGTAGGGGLRGVYVDDWQMFAATALYTAATYSVPTSQASLTVGTTALFNFNGTNGGTSFPNVTS